jgi:lysylphosphatidylglycerol synthetase-like protein (DUF2156 family)
VPIKLELLPVFIAFLVTLIPFYHGALRHLDMTYVEQGGKQVRSGALLADFTILFIESCLLLALAILLPTPQFFAWGLAALLTIDTIWAFFAHLCFSQAVKPKAELRWGLINLITTGVLVMFFVMIGIFPPMVGGSEPKLGILILTVSVVRTVIDYAWCWDFYYPSA